MKLLDKAIFDSKVKRFNQRLVQIEKTFGKDSGLAKRYNATIGAILKDINAIHKNKRGTIQLSRSKKTMSSVNKVIDRLLKLETAQQKIKYVRGKMQEDENEQAKKENRKPKKVKQKDAIHHVKENDEISSFIDDNSGIFYMFEDSEHFIHNLKSDGKTKRGTPHTKQELFDMINVIKERKSKYKLEQDSNGQILQDGKTMQYEEVNNLFKDM